MFISSAQSLPFILASGSQIRQKMLRNAGLKIDVQKADIDERRLQAEAESQNKNTDEIALMLSEYKAKNVAQNYPESYVIGCDQILVFDDAILNKSPDLNAAKDKLIMLSGKTHSLISAASVVYQGKVVWSCVDRADLKMKSLNEEQITDYLSHAGDDVLSSVAAYKLEEHGPWLFDKIQGDFFTILGFPLIPFLNWVHDLPDRKKTA